MGAWLGAPLEESYHCGKVWEVFNVAGTTIIRAVRRKAVLVRPGRLSRQGSSPGLAPGQDTTVAGHPSISSSVRLYATEETNHQRKGSGMNLIEVHGHCVIVSYHTCMRSTPCNLLTKEKKTVNHVTGSSWRGRRNPGCSPSPRVSTWCCVCR